MAQRFFPIMFIMIPASEPHPPNTEYKVSIGKEEWNGIKQPVLKVQMVYNGKVAGRLSPSYPIGTNDNEKVQKAIEKLTEKYNKNNDEDIQY